jgi:hypothetical protein
MQVWALTKFPYSMEYLISAAMVEQSDTLRSLLAQLTSSCPRRIPQTLLMRVPIGAAGSVEPKHDDDRRSQVSAQRFKHKTHSTGR